MHRDAFLALYPFATNIAHSEQYAPERVGYLAGRK
ncbi:hypothetical protein NOV72_01255 [Caballeronia novacaledonica]|uniref:Uncharacterized protein n=1 Tax=Caballeronia novacaledonica TaxID=1544861 RepID=A0A2U3I1L0_9BURK|nr:hypothetical protein NOV72_01255 [Caballeronia novacaledonica]